MKDNALQTGGWEEGGASSCSRGLDFKILDDGLHFSVFPDRGPSPSALFFFSTNFCTFPSFTPRTSGQPSSLPFINSTPFPFIKSSPFLFSFLLPNAFLTRWSQHQPKVLVQRAPAQMKWPWKGRQGNRKPIKNQIASLWVLSRH